MLIRLFFTFTLFILCVPILTTAQDNFTWDNATVYFVLTDRFNNVVTSNDNSYGRTSDPVGGFLGGDLKGLTAKINDGYFTDLGVTAIWLTAPYEQIHGAVPGYWGPQGYPGESHYAYHGYYALDFSEVDANMGTSADMTEFVDAAHDNGIRVVMDIVLNHVGYETKADAEEFGFGPLGDPWQVPNNGLDAENSGWCNWWTDDNGNAWLRKGDTASDYCSIACGGSDLELCLAGLPDVRTDYTGDVGIPKILQTKWDREGTRAAKEANLNNFFNNSGLARTPTNYIVKWLADWVRDYGIDGFRIDTYKHVERQVWGVLKDQSQIAFDEWKTANPSKKLNDDPFWMVGEWYGHGPNKNADAVFNGKTDALINFDFQSVPSDVNNLEGSYAGYANIAADPEWNFLSYISSHDTYLFDRNDLYDGGTGLLLAPGAVQIFYGDETARPGGTTGSDQDSRSFMNWGSVNQGLLSHWQKLGQFRKNHPSVGGGAHQKLGDNPYTFHRSLSNGNMQDQIVATLGASGSTTINVGSVFPDGTELRDFYTGTVATVSGGNVTFTAHSNGVILLEETNPVLRPTFTVTPAGGYSADPINVSITATDANDPNPTIYYTFDANLAATNLGAWMVYNGSITVSESSDLRVIVQNADDVVSREGNYAYFIGALPTFTVYLKSDWALPTVYAWDALPEGTREDGMWPGLAMTNTCGDWYEYTFENILSTNLIFSNNGGAQTDDLSRDKDGWYVNGSWSDTAPADFTNCDDNGGGGGGDPVTNPLIIHFKKPDTWATANMYFWQLTPTSATSTTTWPGITMTDDGNDWYSATVSDASCGNIVFSNNGATQSPDLNACGEMWYINGCWFDYDPSSGNNGDLTIRFKNTSFANPHIYYWAPEPTGSVASTTWPGVPMTDEGGGTFSYTFPATQSINFIFSDTGGNQSPDLNTCQSVEHTQDNYANPQPIAPPLAVELTDFQVMAINCDAQLSWQTAKESLSHYEIEVSTNGNNFEPIEAIPAQNRGNYQISFPQRAQQKFARLKLVERDGSYSYSTIVSMPRDCTPPVRIQPNPFTDQLQIEIIDINDRPQTIEVYDLAGRQVLAHQLQQSDNQQINLNTSKWSSSVYFVKISYVNGVEMRKVVKR